MKKLLFFLCICALALTSFGKKVVVIEVNKEGTGWQNFFNCYERVSTTFQGLENGTTYVTLDCLGNGFNYCRASREIGEISSAPTISVIDVMRTPAVIDAVNNMIAASENVCKKGTMRGSNSQKISVKTVNSSKLYFVKATWDYKQGDPTKGSIIITIEEDDSNLMNVKTR